MTDNQSARDALTSAGWADGRSVDISSSERALTEAGYTVWPSIIDFLQQFSKLNIVFTRNGRRDWAWFDAEQACRLTNVRTVASYEPELRAKLIPIGYAYHDHLLLLAAQDGRFFGVYDSFVSELGTSILEVVDKLINNKVQAAPNA